MNILDPQLDDTLMLNHWMEVTNVWLKDLTYQLEKSVRIVYQPITEIDMIGNELEKMRGAERVEHLQYGVSDYSTLLVIWWNVDYYSDPARPQDSNAKASITKTWVVEEQYWRDCLGERGGLNCDYEWFHAVAVYNPASGEFFPMNTSHFPNLRECVNKKYPSSITTTFVLPSGDWMEKGFTGT